MHWIICVFLIGHLWPHSRANANVGQRSIAEPSKTMQTLPVLGQQASAYVNTGIAPAAVPGESQIPYYQQGVAALTPVTLLRSPCADNFTCSSLPNAYCSPNRTCQCMANFIEDPVYTGVCRLAPGYNELCASGEVQCRQPFVCNATNTCDCKPGFLQEYFQCVKDCPNGQVPVGDSCMTGRQLDEKCETNEQCMQSYAQCLNNKCQCIHGTNQLNGHCYPVNQCPLGEPAKDKRGKVQTCASDNEEVCAKDFYCLHAEVGSASGFCCPKITCPAGHPIQKDGKCYAKSAYRGHCIVDEQCYSVLGASCRKDKEGSNRCMCPDGNFRNFYGRCLKEAGLGEECTTNEECRQGTNTLCSGGTCTCFSGYVPEPVKQRSVAAQRCIAEPSCPSPAGLKPMETYVECGDSKQCKENEFCRRWWNEANNTYSLCCPKPKFSDYEAMCKPFRMKLLSIPKKSEPQRCDIASISNQQYFFAHDAAGNASTPILCPVGASCLFDPYSMDKGICCKPDDANYQMPFGQYAVAPVATQTYATNRAATTVVAWPSARTVQPLANQNATLVTNVTPKEEEIEEEELAEPTEENPPKSQQPTSVAPTAVTGTGRGITQMNSSPRLSSNSNIPVVRIRGFSNQQG